MIKKLSSSKKKYQVEGGMHFLVDLKLNILRLENKVYQFFYQVEGGRGTGVHSKSQAN